MTETNSVKAVGSGDATIDLARASGIGSRVESLKALLSEIAAREVTENDFRRVVVAATESSRMLESLRSLLDDWNVFAESFPTKTVGGVLQGYCLLLTGRNEEAEEVLSGLKRNEWGCYHLARLLSETGRREQARDVCRDAHKKFPDFLPVAYLLVELRCRLKEHDAAEALLAELKKSDGKSARHVFSEGIYKESIGDYAEAIELYREAIERDDEFAEGYFRLGYLLDLHGSDADEANEEAVAAYETCVRLQPIHTNAVINLAILYDDRERYHDAIRCYDTVLRVYPNHARAKLYLGDARASTNMFYDKDQEKKADRQSQVLKIPVTDFELSVRSRNCLQKMNIRTLGDLIMKTEQELLSYKNFGETSLDEIKVMLNQKGLRLGQGLDDQSTDGGSSRNPLEATAPSEVLDRAIDELDLSVRSRRCMERLGVRSVRELINKTEVELMAAKNFGMTSLNEIKRKLAELGLGLRG